VNQNEKELPAVTVLVQKSNISAKLPASNPDINDKVTELNEKVDT